MLYLITFLNVIVFIFFMAPVIPASEILCNETNCSDLTIYLVFFLELEPKCWLSCITLFMVRLIWYLNARNPIICGGSKTEWKTFNKTVASSNNTPCKENTLSASFFSCESVRLCWNYGYKSHRPYYTEIFPQPPILFVVFYNF